MAKHNVREEQSGRYAKSDPCEACGKPAGMNYFSLTTCNQDAIGVVICKRCANRDEETIHRLIVTRNKLRADGFVK
jgi:ribosomal protein S14